MPAKAGGGTGASRPRRNKSVDNKAQQPATTQQNGHVGRSTIANKSSQPKFNIAPLILEGVKINKIQLNDILKQHLGEVKITDIQLSRTGIFTLYSADVKSFNRLLNDLTAILESNGQASAKVYVPRSIQRITDTEKVAFMKRVDLELPTDRISEALKTVGLDVTNVIRLAGKDGKTPTRTVKVTFSDAQNRNTFVHTGLQVDCMHFTAEPATQNTKPVQCYICLKYNHVAKYCRTKQQVCARCGENHSVEQCTAASDAVKCPNCKGNHLATSKECSYYLEQEKRMLNLINQYASPNKQITTAPALHNYNEFPPLPTSSQRRQDFLNHELFDEIINALSSKMEKIIEETTTRLFKKLQQKITQMETTLGLNTKISHDSVEDISDSDTNDEETVNQPASTTKTTTKQTTHTSQVKTAQGARKKKEQTHKRVRSANTSHDSTTLPNKDMKTSDDNDQPLSHQH